MKQVIVMRTDLGMSAGKMVAQGAHAVAGCPKSSENVTRIAVGVETEKTLLKIYEKAKEAGLPRYLIQDSGRTEVEPGTYTCLAIGPCEEAILNPITEHLKLLK